MWKLLSNCSQLEIIDLVSLSARLNGVTVGEFFMFLTIKYEYWVFPRAIT